MNQMERAIEKAVSDQYPNGKPASPYFIQYTRDEKKSARTRWSEHFALQLKSNGYLLMPPNSKYNGEGNTVVFPEFKFHPERKWSMDFAFPKLKISVEIEGGIWMKGGGAHSRPMNIQRDVEKQNAAVLLGWRPLRFSDKEIRAGVSIQSVMQLHANLLSSKAT